MRIRNAHLFSFVALLAVLSLWTFADEAEAQADRQAEEEREPARQRQALLAEHPEADTNKDGVLDGREAEAFRTAVRGRDSAREMKKPERRPEGDAVEAGKEDDGEVEGEGDDDSGNVGQGNLDLPPTAKRMYEPTAESLRQWKTPQWFEDAVLGFYVHWSPGSVPGFAFELPSERVDSGIWYGGGIYRCYGPNGFDPNPKDPLGVYKFHTKVAPSLANCSINCSRTSGGTSSAAARFFFLRGISTSMIRIAANVVGQATIADYPNVC